MRRHAGGHAFIGVHCVAATVTDAILVVDLTSIAENLCKGCVCNQKK